MIVADRIGVMNAGKLAQVAPPAEIYERPGSRWVADFLGEVTLIEGKLAPGGTLIDSALGRLKVTADPALRTEGRVWLAIRPEKLRIGTERPDGEVNALAGTVYEIGYRGDMSLYKVRLADRSLMKVVLANTTLGGRAPFDVNDLVWLSWPAEAGVVLTQ